MVNRAATVQEWFSLNQKELIECPYQAGNLKISKANCLKQRRRSNDWVYGTTPENYILFAFEMHLKVCKECDQLNSLEADFDGDAGPKGRRFVKMGRPKGKDQREPNQPLAVAERATKSRKVLSVENGPLYREPRRAKI